MIVHSLDRWARNLTVLLQTLDALTRGNVVFVSVSEGIDFATPAGKLTASMLGAMAEFFVGNLATHVRKGLRERSRQGLKNGDIPFGYVRCRPDENCPPGDGEHDCAGGVHIVEAEAEAIQELFVRYARTEVTQAELARFLNERGHRTRNKRDHGRGAKPMPFTTWSVGALLQNPFYRGLVRTGDGETFDGQHQPVVEASLFEQAQARRARSSQRRGPRKATREYLLRGLLACSLCATPFWSETLRKKNSYYRGARKDQRHNGEPCPCTNRMFPCREVDARVGVLVHALTLPKEWLDAAKAEVRSTTGSEDDRERRRARLGERRTRLATLYADGVLTEAEYRSELKSLRADEAELRDVSRGRYLRGQCAPREPRDALACGEPCRTTPTPGSAARHHLHRAGTRQGSRCSAEAGDSAALRRDRHGR